jgi:predicted TPR repeat methyltransferase
MNARNYSETKAIRRRRALERACESAKAADTAFFRLNQSTGKAYRLHIAARQLREQIEAMSEAISAPTIEED